MKRLMASDYNPVTGQTTNYWSHDGKITIQVLADVEPNVIRNRQIINSKSAKAPQKFKNDGHGTLVGSIPFAVVEQVRKERGLDLMTCSSTELKRFLNDPNNKAFRTAYGWL